MIKKHTKKEFSDSVGNILCIDYKKEYIDSIICVMHLESGKTQEVKIPSNMILTDSISPYEILGRPVKSDVVQKTEYYIGINIDKLWVDVSKEYEKIIDGIFNK
jgi:hypothetical protein